MKTERKRDGTEDKLAKQRSKNKKHAEKEWHRELKTKRSDSRKEYTGTIVCLKSDSHLPFYPAFFHSNWQLHARACVKFTAVHQTVVAHAQVLWWHREIHRTTPACRGRVSRVGKAKTIPEVEEEGSGGWDAIDACQTAAGAGICGNFSKI